MASLTEVREEMAAKRQELHTLFEEAGSDLDLSRIKSIDGDTAAKAGEIKRRNDELTALGIEYDRLSLVEQIGRNNAQAQKGLNAPLGGMAFPGPGGGSPSGQHQDIRAGLKALLRDDLGLKAMRERKAQSATIDVPGLDFKTLVQLSGVSPQADRRPTVPMALEDRTVSDLMLEGTTDRNAIDYYEETTFTNAAVEKDDGVAFDESVVAFTLRTDPVRDIGHHIPATLDAINDNAWLESQLRGRMAFGVRRREEYQLLRGDGNAPNLKGILARQYIQTTARGVLPSPDAIYIGMQLVRGSAGYGFAEPTAVVFHPTNWTPIKLLRTADGIYIWGNPSDEGPDRIWGLQVRQTTAMLANTALVGAFRPHAMVIRREGLTIQMSTEHATNFTERKVEILAYERAALQVDRPSAFCTVTGLPTS